MFQTIKNDYKNTLLDINTQKNVAYSKFDTSFMLKLKQEKAFEQLYYKLENLANDLPIDFSPTQIVVDENIETIKNQLEKINPQTKVDIISLNKIKVSLDNINASIS